MVIVAVEIIPAEAFSEEGYAEPTLKNVQVMLETKTRVCPKVVKGEWPHPETHFLTLLVSVHFSGTMRQNLPNCLSATLMVI